MVRLGVAQPAMGALAPRLAPAEHGAHAPRPRIAATRTATARLTAASQVAALHARAQALRLGHAPPPMAALAPRHASAANGVPALPAFIIATVTVMVIANALPRTVLSANAQEPIIPRSAQPAMVALEGSLVSMAYGGLAK